MVHYSAIFADVILYHFLSHFSALPKIFSQLEKQRKKNIFLSLELSKEM